MKNTIDLKKHLSDIKFIFIPENHKGHTYIYLERIVDESSIDCNLFTSFKEICVELHPYNQNGKMVAKIGAHEGTLFIQKVSYDEVQA